MQTNYHMSVLVHEQAKKYGDREMLIYQDFAGKEWKSLSWNQVSQTVKQISNALLNLGVKVQENIGIFSQNSVQYIECDFAAWGIRAVTIPFYATSSEQQITLERIIVFDPLVQISTNDPNAVYFSDFVKLGENLPRQIEVERLQKEASFDDIANILYTSGTTGNSKGVILTHGQFNAAMVANSKCVPVNENDRIMNFLPYTHIFERGWAMLCLYAGARLIVNTYPLQVQQSMRETHPTCMSAVPRFWEKVYMGVMDKIEHASAMQRKLFMHALSVGRKHNIEYLSLGKKPPLPLHLERIRT